jgi:Family of unknown function (DUF6788)
MAEQSTAVLRRRIEQIKEELSSLGPLRPGSLSQQYNVCGTPGCCCKADPPEKHGPYYQLSYTWQGKSRTESVLQRELSAVREQLHNYQRLRTLVDEWIEAGIELARQQRRAVRSPQEKSTPATRISGNKRSSGSKNNRPRAR